MPRKHPPSIVWFVVGATLLALLAGGLWWSGNVPIGLAVKSASPNVLTAGANDPGAYVDNALCVGCHQGYAKQWRESHHARAMAVPSAASVRGDFNDTEYTHQGVTSRFFKRGETFFVRTDGPDGKLGEFEISYAFGVEPLQQYLIALPGGRLQPLQIAWDTERKRWFHLLPKEKAPPGDVLHWTGRYQTANTMCIGCHTTGFEKRYDVEKDSFDSRWKEPNVSCQSCHGPGERHVQWAEVARTGNTADQVVLEHSGLAIGFRKDNPRQELDVCAACHSRRSELRDNPVVGGMRLDQYLPALLTRELYHADGQQLDEVYVDGSFRQSKMYQKGVSCSNCHNPHSGTLRAEGNAVCLQCHTPQANAAFSSAAGDFDTPKHHFHKADSAAAQCTSCHMPAKAYMQVQARADHSLRVPRPDLTVKIGTPNACNNCHSDKSAQWAADQVTRWYGPVRKQGSHYGEALAAARSGRPGGNEALTHLVSDTLQPPIVRASALNELRAVSATDMSARIEATRDTDPEVRAAAADSLELAPASQRVYALAPLLRDSVRAVRIAAARSLCTLSQELIGSVNQVAFDAALAEYVSAQNASLDMPGAQLNLAVVYQNTGRNDLAEKHYLAALKIDPDFTPARANLAAFYNAASRNADAEHVLTEGLKRIPGIGELQYSLGLLLAEEKRLPEAVLALRKAARLMPDTARVHYNLGLALQQLGQRKDAEPELLRAQQLDSSDSSVVYALSILYLQSGQNKQALEWANKLESLAPADPQVHQFVEKLRAGR